MGIRLLAGDCREVLATLPADSVHCVCTSPPYYALRSYLPDGHADKHREIGSEPTPDAYLAEMVAVFREIRRVMRHDAVAFVNMGDSYSDKQLLMMPARLALALQADGWWLRSDIIWHKPNPMPESVTDRPTSAHEHVFLLAKAARYYYDADAVREPHEPASLARSERAWNPSTRNGDNKPPAESARWRVQELRYSEGGRNLRNVWTIATAPYSAAHFATYPPALAERCIRAGTSERGCCAACGAPWARQTETGYIKNPNTWGKSSAGRTAVTGSNNWDGGAYPNLCKQVTTTGWAPSCACDVATVPCTVLDPFAGAGTTLLVADRLQRDAIGIELSPDYTRMAMDRCRDDAPLFAEPSPPPAEPLDLEEPRIRDLFA